MILLQLFRDNSFRGMLLVDGQLFCSTIENPDYAIEPGYYPVRVTMSPKFGRLLPILDNVIGRTGIRIHRGSKPEHSRGCILVPADKEQQLVQLLTATNGSGQTMQLSNTDRHERHDTSEVWLIVSAPDPYPLYDVPYTPEEPTDTIR